MKKDVYEYLATVQRQYDKACSDRERVVHQISNGLMSSEECEAFMNYFDNIATNYNRINYIVYLLNKPHPIVAWFLKRREEREIKKKFSNGTLQDVVYENNANLNKMENILGEESDESDRG